MELHPNIMHQFCALQAQLLAMLTVDYPNVRLPQDLHTLPSSGAVAAENSLWQFRKHGLGFTFEEVGSGRVVSMHDSLPDADIVDAWRLLLYLESLGQPELDHAEISAALRSAARRGWLRLVEPGRFKVMNRS